MKKWPLNDNQFSFLDRIKICLFFLNKKNRWTQANQVKSFEIEMANFCDAKYAVFVSSGSTANTLVAMYVKDFIYQENKNIVVLPAVTWQTSCSPWVREGFTPKFIDVSMDNLSMDLDVLEKYLDENHSKVAAVFITSLLGFSPDMERILKIKSKYPSVKFAMDNCESTLTRYDKYGSIKNISSFLTSTTSTYFGHQIQSVEGGFIFTSSKEEYEYYLKARNHGMVRGLLGYEDILEDPSKSIFESQRNHFVDSRFDFQNFGNNFRNSDVNAFLGRLDLKRAEKYKIDRFHLYKLFYSKINKELFLCPSFNQVDFFETDVPFSIPIILNHKNLKNSIELKNKIIKSLEEIGVETRPIISGNLLRQTAYKKFGNPEDFPVAERIHLNGFYVGLHSGVTKKQINYLVNFLNNEVISNIKE